MTTKVGLLDWEFFSENLFSTKNYQAKKRDDEIMISKKL